MKLTASALPIRYFPTLAPVGLVIVGCTAVGPDFEKPDAPVADSWLSAGDPRVDTTKIEYQDWWRVLEDPVLAQLIDTAYQQNLSL